MASFEQQTALKTNFYPCNSAVCSHKQVSAKTHSFCDADAVFAVDNRLASKMRLIRRELLKKVNLQNCLPIFRKALLRIIVDEKGEESDQEGGELEGRGVSIKAFWSCNSFQTENENS